MKLRLAPGFTLPTEAITQTFAVLAKRGAGKTYLMLVMVEEMLKAGLHVVLADPVGVTWGLRASADGKHEGLPIVILGGEHGDLPLEMAAGGLIADAIIEQRFSAILDLSLFRKGEQVRFMTDFAETLYHKNRAALHLVLDEADAFAPQKPQKGQERMLGAVEDLVRRGRARGIGITLTSQRSAVLNKDVLTQCEVLVALRTIAPQDRDAIDAWIRVHGTPSQRDELMASLPSLPIGAAWFWSPGWLDVFKRVEIRKRETFDSSATPKIGQRTAQPKRLADVDLKALQVKMASTIEKAKQEDPRALRAEVVKLRQELSDLRLINDRVKEKLAIRERKEKRIEVPILKDGQITRLEALADKLIAAGRILMQEFQDFKMAVLRLQAMPKVDHRGYGTRVTNHSVGDPVRPPVPRHDVERRVYTRMPTSLPARADGNLGTARQRILNALVWAEGIGLGEVEKTQLGLLADQSPTSGGYFNNLGALRSAGLIEYPKPKTVQLTSQGRIQAEPVDVPTTSEALQEMLYRKLTTSQANILRVLIVNYPKEMGKEQVAESTGQSPTSGGYFNNLGRLRSLGLIDYPSPGQVVAKPVLFLAS